MLIAAIAGQELRLEKQHRQMTMRILHVITNTEVGGAETMLYKVVRASQPLGVESAVVSLMDCGTLGNRILELGVPVSALRINRRLTTLPRVAGLARKIRAFRPHVVQTWMYHADLIGGIAGWFARRPVVWNIRHGPLDESDGQITKIVANLCAGLSRFLPRRVLINSRLAADAHSNLGYETRKLIVVPNGFETENLRPNPELRATFRRQFAFRDETLVFGHCGRYHPVKDHVTFLEAASRVVREIGEVRFVLSGTGVDKTNSELQSHIQRLGIGNYCRLLGSLRDVRPMLNGIDHMVLTSTTEGFPNVIGEAMACGRSCIVTDVGDCASVVGDSGWVVPARNPDHLAKALVTASRLAPQERLRRSVQARVRVVDKYSIHQITQEYVRVWRDVQNKWHHVQRTSQPDPTVQVPQPQAYSRP